ncbi:D-xylose transport system permease protein [Amycolatopsis lurida]|uniref:Xylose transport system permease protein XylH n=1 Tax=Amycolatopsis lurida NRRL 2430 TaxID=1460371 RepID=A0A2P2FM91_AMYLU|nr:MULTISPECIES: ABC transporter permease [Amycolatopsis]KFU77840.1 ABC transporter permease [Amycolatopsis lurida NRRL 2430]QXV58382.1 ABC transporter permease [Amycolatopsis sp. TNS106]SEC69779.1 D-xylose transport system permease protein [Amycolatopsis lurida]
MTETPAKSASPEGGKSAAAALNPSAAITDFGIDTTSMSTREAVGDYFSRLKAGQLGSLPALLGLLVLVIVFASLSDTFLTMNNIANLMAQGAGKAIIAMGIVFVLLLGEIDLSAGTASGVTAAVLAMHYVRNGNLLGGMGNGVFIAFLVVLAIAALLGVVLRIWAGVGFAVLAIALVLSGTAANPWIEMLLAISVGGAIGVLTGFLVSKIGMPSFVVTLALFLAWQGVILQFIGEGGTLGISTSDVLFKVANGNLSTVGSWILFLIAAGGFAAVTLGQHFSRLKRGLVTQPTPMVLFKVGAIAVVAAIATYLLTLNRAPNPNIVISGVPYVVPIVLGLLVLGTYVLNRTQYGRHIYAVGGNREAARRAGINVEKIRASVFVICSAVAAIGAIVYSSKVGSVDPQAGGLNTLLFAVGAAVIGGTSLFGGKGRVVDAVIGGLVLAVVENALGLLKQSAAVVNIVTGLVLLLAATVDALSRRRAAASPR